jgi:hypothetical protein
MVTSFHGGFEEGVKIAASFPTLTLAVEWTRVSGKKHGRHNDNSGVCGRGAVEQQWWLNQLKTQLERA